MEHVSEEPKTTSQEPADRIESAVERYVKHLWWPTLIAGIFEVSALFHPNELTLIIAANAAIVTLAILYTRKEGDGWNTVVVVAAVAGAAGAVLMQAVELITNLQTIYVFKLFTQSATIAVFDAIAAGVIFILVQSIDAYIQTHASKKGGDDNG